MKKTKAVKRTASSGAAITPPASPRARERQAARFPHLRPEDVSIICNDEQCDGTCARCRAHNEAKLPRVQRKG